LVKGKEEIVDVRDHVGQETFDHWGELADDIIEEKLANGHKKSGTCSSPPHFILFLPFY